MKKIFDKIFTVITVTVILGSIASLSFAGYKFSQTPDYSERQYVNPCGDKPNWGHRVTPWGESQIVCGP